MNFVHTKTWHIAIRVLKSEWGTSHFTVLELRVNPGWEFECGTKNDGGRK